MVIPVYNAEGHVRELINALEVALAGLEKYEVLLVDDCSSDNTVDAITTYLQSNHHLRLVQLRRNVGQATATAIGLAHAQCEFVVTLDDDLQHDPKDIPQLVQCLSASRLDFVVACFPESKHGVFRQVASKSIHRIARASLQTPTGFQFSSFMAYRKSFINAAQLLDSGEIELGWMFRLSSKYANHPTSHRQGLRSSSTYRLRTLIRAARPYIRHVLTRTTKPMASLGLLAALSAAVLSGIYIVRYFLVGNSIPGFATLSILALSNIGISSLFLSLTLSWLERIRQLQISKITTAIGSIDRPK